MQPRRRQEMLIVTGMSGAGRSTVGKRPRRPRLVRRRQPAAADAAPAGRSRRARRRRAAPRSRRSSTCAAATCSPNCRRSIAGAARRRQRAGAVPRRDRRGARAPLRAGAAAASAAGRRHAPRRHPRRARAPAPSARERATSSSTPPTSTSTSSRRSVTEHVRGRGRRAGTRVTILSFGFKYGLPADADLVADMRFLPNPFWIPELRALTGEDAAVRDYVLGQQGAAEFIDAYAAALEPGARGLSAREQAARDDRDRLHRRQAPLGRDRRASSPRGCRGLPGVAVQREASRPRPRIDWPPIGTP